MWVIFFIFTIYIKQFTIFNNPLLKIVDLLYIKYYFMKISMFSKTECY